MMMTQERAFLKAQRQLREIEQFVERAVTDGQRIDLVERGLMARLLEIGRTMLEGFVAAQGDGDAGKELPAGEHTVRRLMSRTPAVICRSSANCGFGGTSMRCVRARKSSAARWTNGWGCRPANSLTCWKIGCSGCA